jgi:hypothetical protein
MGGKRDVKGNILELKAHLAATGLLQCTGVDYTELYASVGKYSTWRVFHAMMAGRRLAHRKYDECAIVVYQ